MKTGLIIGKFMPPHRGHEAMILWAKDQFQRLIVLVGALADEPIPGPLRYHWMVKSFKEYPQIQIEYTDEPLPSAPVADREVSKVWADYLKDRFPEADCLISSEEYGPLVAGFMKIGHQSFDPGRQGQPISATMIRKDPVKHWDYILPEARPHFVKKICLYGPESTGKTVMAEKLAKHYQTNWVPETAREILDENGFTITPEILDRIVKEHSRRIHEACNSAYRFLFVDSDCLTTQVYGRYYCGYEPELSDEISQANTFDLYFLFSIDVPWVPDSQRLESQNRKEFFEIFKNELDQRQLPYVTVKGNWEERQSLILHEIQRYFGC